MTITLTKDYLIEGEVFKKGIKLSIDKSIFTPYIEGETLRKETNMAKIDEKSLSRIYQKMQDYDCGMITAYRYDSSKTREENLRINQDNNRDLLASLLTRDYSVTSVKGYFIENEGTPDEVKVREHSFFVADHHGRGDLEKVLRSLGKYFDQDSIIFIPRGEEAELWGTTSRSNSFPGLDRIERIGKAKMGDVSDMMTLVGNRPFILTNVSEGIEPPHSFMGRMGCRAVANKVLKVED